MSLLQQVTLKRFTKVVGQKTYNEYSQLTGIERTRLFRLFHGAEMKVSEYEVFQSFFKEKPEHNTDFSDLDSSDALYDLREQVSRSKRLQSYLEESQKAA